LVFAHKGPPYEIENFNVNRFWPNFVFKSHKTPMDFTEILKCGPAWFHIKPEIRNQVHNKGEIDPESGWLGCLHRKIIIISENRKSSKAFHQQLPERK
jgi:hypothetical protein